MAELNKLVGAILIIILILIFGFMLIDTSLDDVCNDTTGLLYKVSGDYVCSEDMTANLIYIEVYNRGSHSTSTPFEVIDLVTQDVYAQVHNLTTGNIHNFAYQNQSGNITALIAGTYLFHSNFDVSSAQVSGEYGAKVFINEQGQNNCYTHKDLSADVREMVTSCILDLKVNDKVTMRFDDHSNPVHDLNIWNGNINLIRIGD